MTAIEWTDVSWNPVTGCSKVSPGCAHCYAESTSMRFWDTQYPRVPDGQGGTRVRVFEDVQVHRDRLDRPLGWSTPRRIFVNSMSDLWHDDVPDAFIDDVFLRMAVSARHTFQVLTKRAARMHAYLGQLEDQRADFARGWVPKAFARRTLLAAPWPLPNVWLGVSVENQHVADERIPLLLLTPAAVRFISAEPLLGPVDLERGGWSFLDPLRPPPGNRNGWPRGLDWVIVGGESGPRARPFDLAWARSIVRQCQAAGVPVFVKQLGSRPFGISHRPDHGSLVLRDRKGGDMSEWPEDLRVREFPPAAVRL